MARITKQARIDALCTENEQLRSMLASEIRLREAWEMDAKRARLELVRRSHAARPVAPGTQFADLAKAYCETHGVRSCTREQAMSMAGGA